MADMRKHSVHPRNLARIFYSASASSTQTILIRNTAQLDDRVEYLRSKYLEIPSSATFTSVLGLCDACDYDAIVHVLTRPHFVLGVYICVVLIERMLRFWILLTLKQNSWCIFCSGTMSLRPGTLVFSSPASCKTPRNSTGSIAIDMLLLD